MGCPYEADVTKCSKKKKNQTGRLGPSCLLDLTHISHLTDVESIKAHPYHGSSKKSLYYNSLQLHVPIFLNRHNPFLFWKCMAIFFFFSFAAGANENAKMPWSPSHLPL